jgi:hypothetical protein
LFNTTPGKALEKEQEPTGKAEATRAASKGLIELKGFGTTEDQKTRVEYVPQTNSWYLLLVILTASSVVAVHGLNGHPFKSWKEDEVIWFLDLLPKQLPQYDLRVCTFGYNSGVMFSGATFGVKDFALQLLSSLHLLRQEVRPSSKFV